MTTRHTWKELHCLLSTRLRLLHLHLHSTQRLVIPGVGLWASRVGLAIANAMGASGLSRRRAVTLLGMLLLAVGATLIITGRHKKAPPLQTYWCDSS
jgi:hypothetical protein